MSTLERLMARLQCPAVRDLAWAVGSPGLLDASHPAWAGRLLTDDFLTDAVMRLEADLLALDADPAPLDAFLEAHHSHRLGHYFENLVAFWLETEKVGDLRVRQPVREGQAVRGEFDFLFRHAPFGGWQHWEVAVKFYLLEDAGVGLAGFLGPNPHDRLADKVERLFGHQLRLMETDAGRAALGGTSVTARALVKGWLFHPLGEPSVTVPGISARALRGFWLRWGGQPLPVTHTAARWKVLPRLSWLAPALGREGERTLFTAEHLERVLRGHFARASTPLLIAELTQGEDGLWRESRRGFVVGPDWPQAGDQGGSGSGR